jgi:hypothetical protein
LEISSVWPSGRSAAAAAVPTVPPAPARFSMMKGWPNRAAKRSASGRIMMSEVPPGA